jgi:GTP-binding protein YchF
MKIGLVGLPGSGKSTLFRALTGKRENLGHAGDVAVVAVPDPRMDRLIAIYQPRKITPAELTVLDLMAVHGGEDRAGESGELAKLAGDAEAFLLVLQCFGDLDWEGNPLDPVADLETVLLEMALADLHVVETRLKRIEARGSAKEIHEQWEMELLKRVQAHLSSGGAVRDLALAADEAKQLRGFSLLTLKPWLVVCNVADDDLASARAAGARKVCDEREISWLALCAPLEEEIAQLAPEERAEFAAEYGLEEPARDRLIHAAYRLLDVLTFFTCDEKEVHAWTLTAGGTAPEAAGTIHTDLQQGFIRAEIIPYQAVAELGSEKAAKEKGFQRVEGRNYVMQDGDLVYIRFSR